MALDFDLKHALVAAVITGEPDGANAELAIITTYSTIPRRYPAIAPTAAPAAAQNACFKSKSSAISYIKRPKYINLSIS